MHYLLLRFNFEIAYEIIRWKIDIRVNGYFVDRENTKISHWIKRNYILYIYFISLSFVLKIKEIIVFFIYSD